jgi:transposase
MAKRKRTPSGGYAQNWPAYNAAKRNLKHHFRLLLRELCNCVEQPDQATGRPRLLLSDVIFCIAYKIFSRQASRVFLGDADDAQGMGFLQRVPHFNTLSNYLREDWFTPVLERLIELSSLPLKPLETEFAVDATGFSTHRYARWVDERTSKEMSRREWVKVHLICGVKTHIVSSVIVSWGHDSQFFGRLVTATARNFKMTEVSADRGYISGENMRHVVLTGATPFIAFKSNCRADADYKSTIWKRMLSMFQNEHGRFMSHYNKRNNVETVFSMIKANFGDFVRSEDGRAQANEALAKVLCHNICVLILSIHELGIAPNFDALIKPVTAVPKESAPQTPSIYDIIKGYASGVPWPGDVKPKRKRKEGPDPNQLPLFN